MRWLVAWLGCSRGPTVAETPDRIVSLCAPWSERDLPVEGGQVAFCDLRRLTVLFPPGRADELGPAWRLAIRMTGWEEDVDSSAPGLVNVRYLQDGRRLDLSIIDSADRTLAVLTELHP